MAFRLSLATLALAVVLATPGAALAQGWGTVKGQVVWGPEKLPEKVRVLGVPAALRARGPVFQEEYVVHRQSKGVRWVLVWLVDAPLPIHPDLREVPKNPVVIDIPCCQFEPRVVGLREGQPLVVKSAADVVHDIFWQGGALGPNAADLLPGGGNAARTYAGIKARLLPIPYTCNIHAWMKGYVGVFKHPYFAVTDEDGNFTIAKAPAGKYRLLLWQETRGWVIQDEKNPREKGIVVEITPGTTDVGKVKLVPRKD